MKHLIFVSGLLFSSLLSQSQWSSGSGLIYYNGGNVGIGTTNASGLLHIAQNDGASDAVRAPIILSRYWSGSTDTRAAALFNYHNSGNNNDQLVFAVTGSGGSVSSPLSYSQAKMVIQGNGNVGIGTTSPEVKLQIEGVQLINGDIRLGSNHNSIGYGRAIAFGYQSNYDPIWMARYNIDVDRSELRLNLGDDANDRFVIGYSYYENGNWTPSVSITSAGQMSVGTTYVPTGYKLAVGGNFIAEKVKVQLQANWPDYVFHPSYKLTTLNDLEAYIKQNNHLPEVPSAAEVEKNGVDLGDNQATLLKKLEELTLYLIEQNKRIEKLEASNEQLRLENQTIKESLKKTN